MVHPGRPAARLLVLAVVTTLPPSESDKEVGLNCTAPAGTEAVALRLTLVSHRGCPAPGPPELASDSACDCADETILSNW